MTAPSNPLENIPGLRRIESFSREEMMAFCMELTHAVYPHDQVYGQYCTIEEWIDCPPTDVFRYLADPHNLAEWTWSTRDFVETERDGVLVGVDQLADETKIYCETVVNETAGTVDYHCAWDQPDKLWMIYLMRVIPAERVFGKSGSVVLWTNCHHPNYDQNPFPETAPKTREGWVGDFWPFFYAGHRVEMMNLKRILEYRHSHHLPIGTFKSMRQQEKNQ